VSVLAIIPARGGSKRIPKKNLRLLLGRPLIAWSIEAAKMSQQVDRVVLSTEDEEIARVGKMYGAKVIMRPEELSADDAPTDPVMIHALNEIGKDGYAPKLLVLLQPTSPIRPANLIDDCIQRLRFSGANSLFTGFYGPHFAWTRAPGWVDDPLKRKGMMQPFNFGSRDARKRRQDMDESEIPFLENGSVFVTDTKAFIKTSSRVCPPTEAFEMPMSYSIDIDEIEHFWEAERILCAPRSDVAFPALAGDIRKRDPRNKADPKNIKPLPKAV